ncbi:hypothetical protein B0919_14205 [Hymenobacter sp. CRA2]|nr:hypothetical protein B0919_14205 [Hymenobacter sp. CRA2]
MERGIEAAITKHEKAAERLSRSASSPDARRQFSEGFSTAVALELIKHCPAGQQLYNAFSNTVAAHSPADQLLESIGNDLCASLARHQANGDFATRKPAERMELFHADFLRVVNGYGPQIMRVHGAKANTQAWVADMSTQVTSYLERHCPNALLSLGR